MAKAIVVVSATHVNASGNVCIGYSVSVTGPPHFSYSADYQVNTSTIVSANLIEWKNKIIKEVGEKNTTITGSDIILFGFPS